MCNFINKNPIHLNQRFPNFIFSKTYHVTKLFKICGDVNTPCRVPWTPGGENHWSKLHVILSKYCIVVSNEFYLIWGIFIISYRAFCNIGRADCAILMTFYFFDFSKQARTYKQFYERSTTRLFCRLTIRDRACLWNLNNGKLWEKI